MMKSVKSFGLAVLCFAATILPLALQSCSGDEPDPVIEEIDYSQPEPQSERTILIYSVAANNLLSLLRGDSIEMTMAAPKIEGLRKNVRVLLYFSTRTHRTLSELTTDGFKLIKEYPADIPSTHPDRIKEVIEDTRYLRPAGKYGIIFESHATGWIPDFILHESPETDEDQTAAFSFGSDNTLGTKDTIDIHELADALPDNMFDFIWFDACYMSGIETLYQFRNKTERFVGSVMEMSGSGMPYDKVLPPIATSDADLQQAAEILFNSYNNIGSPISITINDLSRIENLAMATRPLVTLTSLPYARLLQCYSRPPVASLYDFGQYVLTSANNLEKEEELIANFNSALDNVVLYKQISPRDFNLNPISKENFSGINCNVPGTINSEPREEYFLSLDWAKAVYGE